MESLERLQGLHADLVAFSEQRLVTIDRLWQELESSIQEFRKLLDKPTPSPTDREIYKDGKISINEQEYAVNDDFRHVSRAIGTVLDLDEIAAGQLLIESQASIVSSDQSYIANAVRDFHERRDLVLQSLRLLLQESFNIDLDQEYKLLLQEKVAEILDIRAGPASNGSLFAARCLNAMEDIEKWQVKIADQLQSKAILGEPRGPEFYATLEFQKDSLFKQHEALGCILAFLFRGNYTISEDLRKLERIVKRWNRLDFLLVHYLPAFSAGFRQYGSPDGSSSQDNAKSLNSLFTKPENDPSSALLRPLRAVLSLWWTAEYSGWFREHETDSEADARAEVVKTALGENAFEFLLSISTSVGTDMWRHPARQEMVSLLLSSSSGLAINGEQTSTYFRMMLMENLEFFIEAFITNMPDSIRRLKNDEDDQRLAQITAMQEGLQPNALGDHFGPLHLESFLILISFAFEHRPEAAEQWWEDPDSNLYGFLQWSSKRQTVPRVSAFCEMLCSISESPESATAAHKFLLDESIPVPTSRTRRIPSMNYQQMFAELDLYAHKVHERGPTSQIPNVRKVLPTDMNEVESPVMLSCYLRLITHLCRQNAITRQFFVETTTLDLPQTLLLLSSGPVPTYLRASVLAMLNALLTDKDSKIGFSLWKTIDHWASNGHDAAAAKTNQASTSSSATLQNTLSSISVSFDQYDAFVVLLCDLLKFNRSADVDGPMLPFPNDLGSAYRAPGVEPYIDFVCSQIFVKRIRELNDDSHAMMCSFHCLDLVVICLESFNENYVAMVDRSSTHRDVPPAMIGAMSYAQLHPFARLMQWLLGPDMNRALMKTMHVSVDVLELARPDSPLVANLQRCIDVLNLVLDLQPTYLDLIRPMLKDRSHTGSLSGANVFSIEDSILAHPNLVLDLCQYAATEHLPLAIRSLALLQKLSSSPKLNSHFLSLSAAKGGSRRVVDMLGPNAASELDPVAMDLKMKLQINLRELEGGFESPGYLIKDGILAFTNSCLKTQSELPNIAHVILGFGRIGDRLTVSNQIDDGTSVLNAIVDLVQNYPDNEDGITISWLVHVRNAAIRVLEHLWSSPLSKDIALGQLRRLRLLPSLFITAIPITQASLWDGINIQEPNFWYRTSAEALAELLAFRAAMYHYTELELRTAAAQEQIISLKQSFSTLQGKSLDFDDSIIMHASVFDLFDFLDLDITGAFGMPELAYFGDIDFDAYMTKPEEDGPDVYDLGIIRELIQTYQSQFLAQQSHSQTTKTIDEEQLNLEADGIVALLESRNRWTLAKKAQKEALHRYVMMVIAVMECCPMDPSPKIQFILHMLQLVLPKLDNLIAEESEDTSELATLADSLLFALSQITHDQERMNNIVTEKLFQLFRTCIEGIPASQTSLALRTTLYSICSHYLTRITNPSARDSDVSRKARSNCMDCIRSTGMRLMNTLCDDAEDGIDNCRLNAFNLLALLTTLARIEKSSYLVEALVKANILEILIDPIKHVASEFHEADPTQRQYLLSVFECRMFLLLEVSRTREGAGSLLDAGLIPALRESMLFRADPDLGITTPDDTPAMAPLENTSALYNYYVLLSSALRVLFSTFFSRGVQNAQAELLMRSFLQEYRPNMVGLFKKYIGVNGKIDDKSRVVLSDCVKSYTGLATLSGFIDFEDDTILGDIQGNGFS